MLVHPPVHSWLKQLSLIDHLRFSWVTANISPEKVAQAILVGIRKRKPIVILPPQAKLLCYINVLRPR